MNRFAPAAAGAVPDSFVDRWDGPAMAFVRAPTRIDSRGRVFFPREEFPHAGAARRFFLVYGQEGEVSDTLWLPPLSRLPGKPVFVRTSRSGGRMVEGLDRVPFAPVASWAVTPRGTLLVSDGVAYVVAELGARGDTVRRFTRPGWRPARIARSERRDSARALAARIDSLPVPISRIENVPEEVREQRLPEHYPAVLRVHAADDGRVWVERWPPPGRAGESFYDVFDGEGRFLGVVVLPVRFTGEVQPAFTANRAAGVVTDPETGVERIAVYTFRPPTLGSQGEASLGPTSEPRSLR